jgi:hypothetical protein
MGLGIVQSLEECESLITTTFPEGIEEINFHDYLKILEKNKAVLRKILAIARRGTCGSMNSLSFTNTFTEKRRKYLFRAVNYLPSPRNYEKALTILGSYEDLLNTSRAEAQRKA